MKKLLSAIISICLLTAIATPCLATNELSMTKAIIGTDDLSVKTYDVKTEFSDIVKSSDGYYAMEMQTKTGVVSVPVGRLDIDLADEQQVTSALARNDISDEIKADLLKSRELVVNGEMEANVVAIFSQLLAAGTSSSTYVTYSGYEFRTDKSFYTNLETSTLGMSGPNTSTIAADLSSIVVSGMASGVTSTNIPIVDIGMTLLRYFLNANTNFTFARSSQDNSWVIIRFDAVRQYTYMNKAPYGWTLGHQSEQITVNRVKHYQYYVNPVTQSGKSNEGFAYPNSTISTPNFNNPYPAALTGALNSSPTAHNYHTFKVFGHTWNIQF